MNGLHRFTILLRKMLVLVIAIGIGLPMAALVYWLCPSDWRKEFNPHEGS